MAGRLQPPDEQLPDEVCELFALRRGQPIPARELGGALRRLFAGRGGTRAGMSLRMKVLLAVEVALGPIVRVREGP